MNCFQHITTSNPKYYPRDEEVHIIMAEVWSERLIMKFGLMSVESNASRVELLAFVEKLRYACKNKSLYGASKSGISIGHIS